MLKGKPGQFYGLVAVVHVSCDAKQHSLWKQQFAKTHSTTALCEKLLESSNVVKSLYMLGTTSIISFLTFHWHVIKEVMIHDRNFRSGLWPCLQRKISRYFWFWPELFSIARWISWRRHTWFLLTSKAYWISGKFCNSLTSHCSVLLPQLRAQHLPSPKLVLPNPKSRGCVPCFSPRSADVCAVLVTWDEIHTVMVCMGVGMGDRGDNATSTWKNFYDYLRYWPPLWKNLFDAHDGFHSPHHSCRQLIHRQHGLCKMCVTLAFPFRLCSAVEAADVRLWR